MRLLDFLERKCYVHLILDQDSIECRIIFDYLQWYFSGKYKKLEDKDNYVVIEISYHDVFMLNLLTKLVLVWLNRTRLDRVIKDILFDKALPEDLQDEYLKLWNESDSPESMMILLDKILTWRITWEHYKVTKQDEFDTWISVTLLWDVVEEINAHIQRSDIVEVAFEWVIKDDWSAFIIAFLNDSDNRWTEIKFNTIESSKITDKRIEISTHKKYIWIHLFQVSELLPATVVARIKSEKNFLRMGDLEVISCDTRWVSRSFDDSYIYDSALGYIDWMRIMSERQNDNIDHINIWLNYNRKKLSNLTYNATFNVIRSAKVFSYKDILFNFEQKKFHVWYESNNELCMNMITKGKWYYQLKWRDEKTLANIWYIYVVIQCLNNEVSPEEYQSKACSDLVLSFIKKFHMYVWSQTELWNVSIKHIGKLKTALRSVIEITQSKWIIDILNFLQKTHRKGN